jgi:hypothetical protein
MWNLEKGFFGGKGMNEVKEKTTDVVLKTKKKFQRIYEVHG